MFLTVYIAHSTLHKLLKSPLLRMYQWGIYKLLLKNLTSKTLQNAVVNCEEVVWRHDPFKTFSCEVNLACKWECNKTVLVITDIFSTSCAISSMYELFIWWIFDWVASVMEIHSLHLRAQIFLPSTAIHNYVVRQRSFAYRQLII